MDTCMYVMNDRDSSKTKKGDLRHNLGAFHWWCQICIFPSSMSAGKTSPLQTYCTYLFRACLYPHLCLTSNQMFSTTRGIVGKLNIIAFHRTYIRTRIPLCPCECRYGGYLVQMKVRSFIYTTMHSIVMKIFIPRPINSRMKLGCPKEFCFTRHTGKGQN